jgi:hypothetical protein
MLNIFYSTNIYLVLGYYRGWKVSVSSGTSRELVLWRNFGPLNQEESLRSQALTDRVARSAGLRSVATYLH